MSAINPLSGPLKVFLLDLLAHDPDVQAAVRQIVRETLRVGEVRSLAGPLVLEPPARERKGAAAHVPWLQPAAIAEHLKQQKTKKGTP